MTNIPTKNYLKTDKVKTKFEFINGFTRHYRRKFYWLRGPCNQTSAALGFNFPLCNKWHVTRIIFQVCTFQFDQFHVASWVGLSTIKGSWVVAQSSKAPSAIVVDGAYFRGCINNSSRPCCNLDAVFWLAVLWVQTAVVVDVVRVFSYMSINL